MQKIQSRKDAELDLMKAKTKEQELMVQAIEEAVEDGHQPAEEGGKKRIRARAPEQLSRASAACRKRDCREEDRHAEVKQDSRHAADTRHQDSDGIRAADHCRKEQSPPFRGAVEDCGCHGKAQEVHTRVNQKIQVHVNVHVRPPPIPGYLFSVIFCPLY